MSHTQQTPVRTTQLGATGLEITRVGFGAQVDPILTAATIELTRDDIDEIEARNG